MCVNIFNKGLQGGPVHISEVYFCVTSSLVSLLLVAALEPQPPALSAPLAISLPQQDCYSLPDIVLFVQCLETTYWQKAREVAGVTLFLRELIVLLLIQHLKTLVSYILSSFVVDYSWWVSLIPVTPQLTWEAAFVHLVMWQRHTGPWGSHPPQAPTAPSALTLTC